MFKNLKRLIALSLLAVLLCISCDALAASGSSYTSNSSLAKKLDKLINGEVAIFSNTTAKFPVGSSLNNSKTYYWKDNYYSGKQCYAYGQAAYYYLFGDVPYHGNGSYSNSKAISGVKGLKELSYNVLSKAGVGCGAYIRTTINSDGSYHGSKAHSMILLKYDSSSITILHGNADGNGLVSVNTYTWAKFNSAHLTGRSRYVCHIIQPNLTSSSNYTKLDSTPRIAKSIKDATGADTCRLQSAPYDAEQYYTGKLAKGTIVYLQGAVKNSYGNTWYQTEDGKFIYSGDLEILEDNAIIKSESKFGAVGVSKNKDCYLKDKPYEASAHSTTVAKGKTVEIVAKVVNSHGNTWYKTSDGKYVYSSDVTTYECKELFDISAKFRNTEKRDSHAAPYANSPDVKSYAKDAEVTATRFVVNSHGNIWVQLSDGSYLCFYDFDSDENKLKYVGTMAAVTVTEVKKPTGDLKVGASFGIRGVLTSKVPFYRVSAHVIDLKAQDYALEKVTVYPSMTTRTVNLNKKINGTNINEITYFNKLPQGYYRYAVTAWMGFTYNGKTFNFGSDTVLIQSEFTVGSPKEEEIVQPEKLDNVSFSASSSSTGAPGGTVVIPVTIQNPDAAPLGSITLTYDLPAGVTISKANLCGSAASASVSSDNRVTWITSLDSGIKGSGKILELTLKLGAGVTLPTEFSLNFEIVHATELVSANPAPVTVRIGGETKRTPGDVNLDGKINSLDAFAVLKYSVGYEIAINTANADVNADDKINSLDAFMILKKSVGYDIELK